jgi:hypothetical protein
MNHDPSFSNVFIMHIEFWWESQKERDPLGRPRRRWVDNIKMDLIEIGWSGLDGYGSG